ncbi:hypothetical protein [uncultured Alistipes sp.]|jgi:hypothetical protein|uniref:hypothetical protein n=1 Tax=uncultured Alistipes sp. TaxID=538949 RepID=UPI0025F16F4F|nr:hypothetical protein [uncultured Alistipes sp.]
MKNFIEVTINDSPALINVYTITEVVPAKDKSLIYLCCTHNDTVRWYTVREDYETVKALIADAVK